MISGTYPSPHSHLPLTVKNKNYLRYSGYGYDVLQASTTVSNSKVGETKEERKEQETTNLEGRKSFRLEVGRTLLTSSDKKTERRAHPPPSRVATRTINSPPTLTEKEGGGAVVCSHFRSTPPAAQHSSEIPLIVLALTRTGGSYVDHI